MKLRGFFSLPLSVNSSTLISNSRVQILVLIFFLWCVNFIQKLGVPWFSNNGVFLIHEMALYLWNTRTCSDKISERVPNRVVTEERSARGIFGNVWIVGQKRKNVQILMPFLATVESTGWNCLRDYLEICALVLHVAERAGPRRKKVQPCCPENGIGIWLMNVCASSDTSGRWHIKYKRPKEVFSHLIWREKLLCLCNRDYSCGL